MSLNVIEANQNDFQKEVIQRSNQLPVIWDFWAPWCGPCRMIGPVLERLAGEFNGRFILAKVNADHNPQLSAQYDVRGIPAVKAFWNGHVVDEFVGAQPEPMIRQFIQKLMANAHLVPSSNGYQKQQQDPATPTARLQRARQLLKQGKGCDALAQLQKLDSSKANSLLPLAQFMCDGKMGKIIGRADLDIAANQAVTAARHGEYDTALYNLLVIKNTDASYRQGQVKAIMAGMLELLGQIHPMYQAYKNLL